MKNIIIVIQILVSILLIFVVLLQSKGAGIGTVFGGSDGVYRSKRGVEKLLVFFTIFLAFLFLTLSILSILIK